jgi:hypothetical protein
VQQLALDIRLELIDPSAMIKLDHLDSNGIDLF